MNTIIVKQNENGQFDVLTSSKTPVKVILVESDISGNSNMEMAGEACIGWVGTTTVNQSLIDEVTSSLESIE
jgi:hypothetical protein